MRLLYKYLRAFIWTIAFIFSHIAFGQEALDLEDVKFSKPPRSVSDVLSMLDQYQADPKRHQALIKEADASPPSGISERDLCLFYQNRSLAAATLGRLNQSEEDSKKAIEFTPLNDKNLIGDSYSPRQALRCLLATLIERLSTYSRALQR